MAFDPKEATRASYDYLYSSSALRKMSRFKKEMLMPASTETIFTYDLTLWQDYPTTITTPTLTTYSEPWMYPYPGTTVQSPNDGILAELARLRQEVVRLRQENDLLRAWGSKIGMVEEYDKVQDDKPDPALIPERPARRAINLEAD